MEFFPKLLGLLVRPSATLEKLKVEEKFEQSFIYLLALSTVGAIIAAVVGGIWLALFTGVLSQQIPSGLIGFGGTFGILMGVFMGIYVFIRFLVGALLWGLWMHIWVYAFGGRGITATLQATMYSFTPWIFISSISVFLLFGFNPLTFATPSSAAAANPVGFYLTIIGMLGVGVTAFVWRCILFAKGVRILHGLTTAKAAAATIIGVAIPVLLTFLLVLLIAFALVLPLAASGATAAPKASIALVDANATHICVEHQGGDSLTWSSTRLTVAGRALEYEGDRDCRASGGGFDLCPSRFRTSGASPSRFMAGDQVTLAVGETLASDSQIGLVDQRSNKMVAAFTVERVQSGALLLCFPT